MSEENTGTETFYILRMENPFSSLTQYIYFLRIEKWVIKAQVWFLTPLLKIILTEGVGPNCGTTASKLCPGKLWG